MFPLGYSLARVIHQHGSKRVLFIGVSPTGASHSDISGCLSGGAVINNAPVYNV